MPLLDAPLSMIALVIQVLWNDLDAVTEGPAKERGWVQGNKKLTQAVYPRGTL